MMDPASDRIYLHIGYSRTATTLLQNVVFPSIRGITYFSKYKALKTYTRSGDPAYREATISRIRECDPAMPILFSDEGLTAPISHFCYMKDLFPNAHILVGLRAQPDRILSVYRHRLQKGSRPQNLRAYLEDDGHARFGENFYLADVAKLMEMFDRRVHVFLFEEYTKNVEQFLAEILAILFAGCPELSTANQRTDGIGLEALVVEANRIYYNVSLRRLGHFVNLLHWIVKPLLPRRRRKAIMRMNISLFAKLEAAVNRVCGTSNWHRAAAERRLVVEMFGRALFHQNRKLEELIGKKLPENYFT